jgi:hypothetical protein
MLDKIPFPTLIFSDTPFGQNNIPTCLARNRSNVAKCVVTRSAAYGKRGHIRDLLIAEQRNLPIFDGRVVYHDHHHLTTTMAKYLATPLGAALSQVIANLPPR